MSPCCTACCGLVGRGSFLERDADSADLTIRRHFRRQSTANTSARAPLQLICRPARTCSSSSSCSFACEPHSPSFPLFLVRSLLSPTTSTTDSLPPRAWNNSPSHRGLSRTRWPRSKSPIREIALPQFSANSFVSLAMAAPADRTAPPLSDELRELALYVVSRQRLSLPHLLC